MVFEYVEKDLLAKLEEKPEGLSNEVIQKTIYQLLKAINYMHQNNIIHRDVKPENLLIGRYVYLNYFFLIFLFLRDGILKLCDFGFARPLPSNEKEIMTDYVATRWYY